MYGQRSSFESFDKRVDRDLSALQSTLQKLAGNGGYASTSARSPEQSSGTGGRAEIISLFAPAQRRTEVIPAQPCSVAEFPKPLTGSSAAQSSFVPALHKPRTIISNATQIKEPKEPTLVENTLLFLPQHAVDLLGIEPNMDDKGEKEKTLWFGRVWQLRELLAARYRAKLRAVPPQVLSADSRRQLDAALRDPATRRLLSKLAASWKGAASRRRTNFSVLDCLKFSFLRGTLVYAHGSGGCSWDNMRICRMIARMGMLVIAPDGFAYPRNTAMGQMRHKDLKPLIKADDDTDYWAGDLIYASAADGSHNYSTKADTVLDDPDKYRDLYEKCYQLRRSELHFIIGRLPRWVKNQGFFIGGTSEGAMTVSRFDDQRYGSQLIGRFINSFSIEHCYFTPNEEAAKLGGQLDVPTLNIIGTHDEYFGALDSVAALVKDDKVRGYGDVKLDGHGYDQLMEQELESGLICLLDEGLHGPCTTHDNFLRVLFQNFFTRPASVWRINELWSGDPYLKDLTQLQKQRTRGQKLSMVFVPKMDCPQKMTLEQVESLKISKQLHHIAKAMDAEAAALEAERGRVAADLTALRKEARTMLSGREPTNQNCYRYQTEKAKSHHE